MRFKKLKNKKGFSLVEVAIAMAVVSIVTITAIAIIYPATDKTKVANSQSAAIYFAADALECFKATEVKVDENGNKDTSEFYNALMFNSITGVEEVLNRDESGNDIISYVNVFEERNDVTFFPSEDYDYVFQINGSNCRVYINISQHLGVGVGSYGAPKYFSISIVAKDSNDNELVNVTSYSNASR